MVIKHSDRPNNFELPLQLQISFRKVYSFFEKYIHDVTHPYYTAANAMVDEFEKHPELINGFEDISLLNKYEKQIDMIMNPLFPEALQLNEIKAASLPFSFTTFKITERFKAILQNATDEYEFNIRNMEENELYMNACVMILNTCYGYKVDYKRPYFFDIPDKISGITKHYRVAFNGDFSEIIFQQIL